MFTTFPLLTLLFVFHTICKIHNPTSQDKYVDSDNSLHFNPPIQPPLKDLRSICVPCPLYQRYCWFCQRHCEPKGPFLCYIFLCSMFQQQRRSCSWICWQVFSNFCIFCPIGERWGENDWGVRGPLIMLAALSRQHHVVDEGGGVWGQRLVSMMYWAFTTLYNFLWYW